MTVILDVQKLQQRVDCVVKTENTLVKVHAVTNDMYAPIDLAVGKLLRLLSRYHRRLRDHHAKEVNDLIEEANFQEIEAKFAPHEIVACDTIGLPMLTDEEAVMKMELSNYAFLLFRSEGNRKLQVTYRRSDDRYGIIIPEQSLVSF